MNPSSAIALTSAMLGAGMPAATSFFLALLIVSSCLPHPASKTAATKLIARVRLSSVYMASLRDQASFRKHQLDLEPDLPGRAVVGPDGVVIGAELRVHRQLADVEDVPDAAAHRHGPLLPAGGIPVHRRDRAGRQ